MKFLVAMVTTWSHYKCCDGYFWHTLARWNTEWHCLVKLMQWKTYFLKWKIVLKLFNSLFRTFYQPMKDFLCPWSRFTHLFSGKILLSPNLLTCSLRACEQRGAPDWKTLKSWNFWGNRYFTIVSKIAFSEKSLQNLKIVRCFKLRPKHVSFWTWTTRLYL